MCDWLGVVYAIEYVVVYVSVSIVDTFIVEFFVFFKFRKEDFGHVFHACVRAPQKTHTLSPSVPFTYLEDIQEVKN